MDTDTDTDKMNEDDNLDTDGNNGYLKFSTILCVLSNSKGAILEKISTEEGHFYKCLKCEKVFDCKNMALAHFSSCVMYRRSMNSLIDVNQIEWICSNCSFSCQNTVEHFLHSKLCMCPKPNNSAIDSPENGQGTSTEICDSQEELQDIQVIEKTSTATSSTSDITPELDVPQPSNLDNELSTENEQGTSAEICDSQEDLQHKDKQFIEKTNSTSDVTPKLDFPQPSNLDNRLSTENGQGTSAEICDLQHKDTSAEIYDLPDLQHKDASAEICDLQDLQQKDEQLIEETITTTSSTSDITPELNFLQPSNLDNQLSAELFDFIDEEQVMDCTNINDIALLEDGHTSNSQITESEVSGKSAENDENAYTCGYELHASEEKLNEISSSISLDATVVEKCIGENTHERQDKVPNDCSVQNNDTVCNYIVAPDENLVSLLRRPAKEFHDCTLPEARSRLMRYCDAVIQQNLSKIDKTSADISEIPKELLALAIIDFFRQNDDVLNFGIQKGDVEKRLHKDVAFSKEISILQCKCSRPQNKPNEDDEVKPCIVCLAAFHMKYGSAETLDSTRREEIKKGEKMVNIISANHISGSISSNGVQDTLLSLENKQLNLPFSTDSASITPDLPLFPMKQSSILFNKSTQTSESHISVIASTSITDSTSVSSKMSFSAKQQHSKRPRARNTSCASKKLSKNLKLPLRTQPFRNAKLPKVKSLVEEVKSSVKKVKSPVKKVKSAVRKVKSASRNFQNSESDDNYSIDFIIANYAKCCKFHCAKCGSSWISSFKTHSCEQKLKKLSSCVVKLNATAVKNWFEMCNQNNTGEMS